MTKFGAGAYDVHIMQNAYRIVAPRRLSDVSCICMFVANTTNKTRARLLDVDVVSDVFTERDA
jgi:hypothetical protein